MRRRSDKSIVQIALVSCAVAIGLSIYAVYTLHKFNSAIEAVGKYVAIVCSSGYKQ